MSYQRILLAVDFSRETPQLCEQAMDLARRYQATLGLIHVVEPIVTESSYDGIPALPLGLEEELFDNARKELSGLGERYGISSERLWVESGSTKSEILRKAGEEDIDLIVVGSHGRHGVALLLGSTANAVLHGAPCDVLAVRIKK